MGANHSSAGQSRTVAGYNQGLRETDLTTSYKTYDLSSVAGRWVRVWVSVDSLFCMTPASGTSINDTSATLATDVACDVSAGGTGEQVYVEATRPHLRVKAKSGSGETISVEVVSGSEQLV